MEIVRYPAFIDYTRVIRIALTYFKLKERTTEKPEPMSPNLNIEFPNSDNLHYADVS
jgi:hypothetical protein